jgi:hypothetical protein
MGAWYNRVMVPPRGRADRKGHTMAAGKQDEWTTVADETPSRIVFDTPGEDVFIGTYVEKRVIENPRGDDFDQFVFTGTDGALYGTNSSYSLARGMAKVNPGQKVRITYVKNVPIPGQPAPMKDFKIDVAK